MARFIALLRGINVGGHRVKMERLRELLEPPEFSNVSTYIASGNIIFDARSSDSAELERRIEARLKEGLGFEADTFLRTPTVLAAVASFQPFGTESEDHTIQVGFLREPLDAKASRGLVELKTALDEFRVLGREYYWRVHGKVTDSLVKPTIMAKTIGASSTVRNVTTIRKLSALYPPS